MPAKYYSNILYPLQDQAILSFKDSAFYLTGGTTLSRGYYNHRFSDNLDYFLNDDPNFQILAKKQIEKLSDIFTDLKITMSDERFYRIFVSGNRLKIEMVNDVPSHVGEKILHPALGLIDSKENILANKLNAAIDRSLPKDIVDIYFLLKDGLSLTQALLDVSSKAAGISPLFVAKTLAEFDYSLIDSEIKWVAPVASDVIKSFLSDISLKIVKGEIDNSPLERG